MEVAAKDTVSVLSVKRAGLALSDRCQTARKSHAFPEPLVLEVVPLEVPATPNDIVVLKGETP